MPDDVVVADASVLILLARVGRLGLLESLFHRIVVPNRVWSEVAADPDRPGADALRNVGGSKFALPIQWRRRASA